MCGLDRTQRARAQSLTMGLSAPIVVQQYSPDSRLFVNELSTGLTSGCEIHGMALVDFAEIACRDSIEQLLLKFPGIPKRD